MYTYGQWIIHPVFFNQNVYQGWAVSSDHSCRILMMSMYSLALSTQTVRACMLLACMYMYIFMEQNYCTYEQIRTYVLEFRCVLRIQGNGRCQGLSSCKSAMPPHYPYKIIRHTNRWRRWEMGVGGWVKAVSQLTTDDHTDNSTCTYKGWKALSQLLHIAIQPQTAWVS